VARARAASSNTSVESLPVRKRCATQYPRCPHRGTKAGRAWPADARSLASRHHFTTGHGLGRRTIPSRRRRTPAAQRGHRLATGPLPDPPHRHAGDGLPGSSSVSGSGPPQGNVKFTFCSNSLLSVITALAFWPRPAIRPTVAWSAVKRGWHSALIASSVPPTLHCRQATGGMPEANHQQIGTERHG
jgi:hypothetical protein